MNTEEATEKTESIGIGGGKYRELGQVWEAHAIKKAQLLKTAIYLANTPEERDKAIEEYVKLI